MYHDPSRSGKDQQEPHHLPVPRYKHSPKEVFAGQAGRVGKLAISYTGRITDGNQCVRPELPKILRTIRHEILPLSDQTQLCDFLAPKRRGFVHAPKADGSCGLDHDEAIHRDFRHAAHGVSQKLQPRGTVTEQFPQNNSITIKEDLRSANPFCFALLALIQIQSVLTVLNHQLSLTL